MPTARPRQPELLIQPVPIEPASVSPILMNRRSRPVIALLLAALVAYLVPTSTSTAAPAGSAPVATRSPVEVAAKGSVTARTYRPSNKLIANPGRGLAVMLGHTGYRELVPPVSAAIDYFKRQRREYGSSTIAISYYLGEWKYTDLPASFLTRMEQDFASARAHGFKVAPHFHYAYTLNQPFIGVESEKDASADRMVRHLRQMRPVLRHNADVLAFLWGGMIGTWGEQWNSTSGNLVLAGGGRGTLANHNTHRIFRAMLKAIPKSRMIVTRNRSLKTSYLGHRRTLRRSTAWRGTRRGRIGFDNQCFMGDDTTKGPRTTYIDGGTSGPWSYMNTEGKFVPVVGFPDPNCIDGTSTVADMRAEMFASNWDLFGNSPAAILGLSEDDRQVRRLIRDMGYRYRLRSSEITSRVSPGGSARVALTMTNVGSGSLYNPQNIEIVLRNRATGATHAYPWRADRVGNRKAFPQPGKTVTWTIPLTVGTDVRAGDYEVLLHLADPAPSIHDRRRYAIRLANRRIWERSTGYNRLDATIRVG
ncbi:MAG: DUF4832 domain-containing protein [Nocardioides sp.]